MGRHTWPPVDPPTSDFDLADAYMTLKSLRQRASTSKCLECPRLPEMRTLARRRRTLRKQIKLLRQRLSNESLSLFPDFQQRLDVLETLGYVNADGAVALKGRVAAQINTADELLLTEMIFESTFGEMEPEEIVALLSALVFQVPLLRSCACCLRAGWLTHSGGMCMGACQAKTTDEPTLTKRLEGARTAATEIAISLGAVQMTCGLDIIPSEYARSVLKFGLMEVVYEWARGVPFRDICTLTSVQEGIIVRTITRLDETCREVSCLGSRHRFTVITLTALSGAGPQRCTCGGRQHPVPQDGSGIGSYQTGHRVRQQPVRGVISFFAPSAKKVARKSSNHHSVTSKPSGPNRRHCRMALRPTSLPRAQLQS